MAFGNFKHLPRSTAYDKIVRDKAINISKKPTYDGFQTGLASMIYKLFDKNIPDQQLAKELCKPFIGKLE